MLLCAFAAASSWPILLFAIDSLRGIDPNLYVPGLSKYPLWDALMSGTINMLFAAFWMFVLKKNPVHWTRYVLASLTISTILLGIYLGMGVRKFEKPQRLFEYVISTYAANLLMFVGVYYLESWLCFYNNPFTKKYRGGPFKLPGWRYPKYRKKYRRLRPKRS
jgi:hypothetical protein